MFGAGPSRTPTPTLPQEGQLGSPSANGIAESTQPQHQALQGVQGAGFRSATPWPSSSSAGAGAGSAAGTISTGTGLELGDEIPPEELGVACHPAKELLKTIGMYFPAVDDSPAETQVAKQIVGEMSNEQKLFTLKGLNAYFSGRIHLPNDPNPPDDVAKLGWRNFVNSHSENIQTLIKEGTNEAQAKVMAAKRALEEMEKERRIRRNQTTAFASGGFDLNTNTINMSANINNNSNTDNNVVGAGAGGTDKQGQIAHASFVDSIYPIGIKLNALYKKGFAHKTIGYRLPVILTKIIDQLSVEKSRIVEQMGENCREEIKDIIGQLAQLKYELQTNKPLRPLPIRSTTNNHMITPDNLVWNNYHSIISTQMNGVDNNRWFNSPWLYVECYLYRRIYDIFQSTEYFQHFDYFQKDKRDGYFGCIDGIINLAEYLLEESAESGSGLTSLEIQKILLDVSLWGNRCDLSLSAGESASDHSHKLIDRLSAMKTYILADQSEEFWTKLETIKSTNTNSSGNCGNIGYVLDNAGFELFTDLCFADCLLNYVNHIDFYVKMVPWFISDTMKDDISWLLDVMKNNTQSLALQKLAKRWAGYFDIGRWRIRMEPFWTYPHAFAEMPEAAPDLYQKLATHSILIFKGDLNYRKLVSDINWEKSTSFPTALYTFRPCPIFSLRTIKADTVVGLPNGLGEEMDRKDPDWMISGEYALLQFADLGAW